MRDWREYVRNNLKLVGVSPAQENEAVEELARQCEDAFADVQAHGLSEDEAENFVLQHVSDWSLFSKELQRTQRYRARKIVELANDPLDGDPRRTTLGFHMSVLAQDLIYSARLLKKQSGVTAIMVISLALGIGANTFIFSFINAVFLRPLPYSDPDELVMVWFVPPNKPALNEPGVLLAILGGCLELRLAG
jgi:hypothetical protein